MAIGVSAYVWDALTYLTVIINIVTFMGINSTLTSGH